MYQKVYFRIETGYVWGKGMSDSEYVVFQEKLKKIFFDWELQEKVLSNSCDTYKKGVSELYCHPQNISGIIDVNLIEVIKKRIVENGIELNRVDTYQEYENLTENEYLQELQKHKHEIIAKIFSLAHTTRKHDYKPIGWILSCANENYNIFSIQDFEIVREKYIKKIFEIMVNDGLLLWSDYTSCVPKNKYVRALNKTELKQYIKKNKDTEYLFLTNELL